MSSLNATRILKRLAFLNHRIKMQDHHWGHHVNVKMEKLQAEYNELRSEWPEVWLEYCRINDLDPGHDAAMVLDSGAQA